MKILIFGNHLIKEDNLIIKILPKLKKEFPNIEFKHMDPTENLEAEISDEGKLRIIDVVESIDKVIVIKDIKQLKNEKVYSMHDFDLGFNLKLLEKIGKLRDVEIIGVPQDINEEKAFLEVSSIINK